MWSPGSSHNTPVTPVPYGAGHSPLFAEHVPHIGAAIIPNHPVEMPGHLHDSGASEIYNPLAQHSAISATGTLGTGGFISPYSAGPDQPKYGNEGWPSPLGQVDEIHAARRNTSSAYAAAGFGPQELSTDPTMDRGSAESRRHETFYHP